MPKNCDEFESHMMNKNVVTHIDRLEIIFNKKLDELPELDANTIEKIQCLLKARSDLIAAIGLEALEKQHKALIKQLDRGLERNQKQYLDEINAMAKRIRDLTLISFLLGGTLAAIAIVIGFSIPFLI